MVRKKNGLMIREVLRCLLLCILEPVKSSPLIATTDVPQNKAHKPQTVYECRQLGKLEVLPKVDE